MNEYTVHAESQDEPQTLGKSGKSSDTTDEITASAIDPSDKRLTTRVELVVVSSAYLTKRIITYAWWFQQEENCPHLTRVCVSL